MFVTVKEVASGLCGLSDHSMVYRHMLKAALHPDRIRTCYYSVR